MFELRNGRHSCKLQSPERNLKCSGATEVCHAIDEDALRDQAQRVEEEEAAEPLDKLAV